MHDDLILGSAPGILIVDDDRDFAESLVDLLVAQGYDTQIADRPEALIPARAGSGRSRPKAARSQYGTAMGGSCSIASEIR